MEEFLLMLVKALMQSFSALAQGRSEEEAAMRGVEILQDSLAKRKFPNYDPGQKP